MNKKLFSVILIFGSLMLTSTVFAGEFSWSGTWKTTFKEMVLTQNGNRVSGSYGHDNGKIAGTVNGNILEGTWHEAGNQTGKFKFVMSSDGMSYTGRWGGNSGALNNDWKGTRTSKIIHTPSPAPKAITSGQSWEGTWKTTFKVMVLTQNGNRVSGTYGHDNGKIVGTVNGNILEGTWHEAGNQTGKFKFVMSSDGMSYAGKWGGNSGALNNRWDGTRISGDQPQSGGDTGDTAAPPPGMEIPGTIGPLHWCLGCPRAPEKRLDIGFTVPKGTKTIIVRVRNGHDDTGDKMVELMVGDPKGRILITEKSATSGWEEFRCPVNIPGEYFVTLRDRDTGTGGQSPGNGGSLKIILE